MNALATVLAASDPEPDFSRVTQFRQNLLPATRLPGAAHAA